jgi:hypothetical protein
MGMSTPPPERLACTLRDFAGASALAPRTVSRELRVGNLRAITRDGRPLITVEEARRYISDEPVDEQ